MSEKPDEPADEPADDVEESAEGAEETPAEGGDDDEMSFRERVEEIRKRREEERE